MLLTQCLSISVSFYLAVIHATMIGVLACLADDDIVHNELAFFQVLAILLALGAYCLFSCLGAFCMGVLIFLWHLTFSFIKDKGSGLG
jgi:hypothetical protein